jgi:hypothetical protein
MRTSFGYEFCKECRKRFEKSAPNQKHCPEHSFHMRYSSGRLYDRLALREKELKRRADASGNPRIFTAAQYNQAFLRSLIPGR